MVPSFPPQTPVETDPTAIHSSALDTDATFAADSDALVPSQKAVKTAVDVQAGLVASASSAAAAAQATADGIVASSDAMVFKAVIDCSANPNYPAADRGWTYKVSVAGKIGGASGLSVEVGDLLLCITDSTASGTQAAVGANWAVVQANVDGAVTGPASATSGDFATFNGSGGKVIQDSGVSLDTSTSLGTSDAKIPSQKAVKTYVDSATPADASTTVKGIAKASVAPASSTSPIFVGDNDPRMSAAAAGTASVRALGTSSTTAAAGDDSRLSDVRDPKKLWTPADQGLLACTIDPACASGTMSAGNQVLYVARVPLKTAITVTNLIVNVTSGSGSLTEARGQLWNLSGTLIARTAIQTSGWSSNGLKTMALTAESGQSLSLPAQDVIVSVWVLGGTVVFQSTPTGQTVALNAGLTTPAFRGGFAVSSTLLTSLVGALTSGSAFPWVALS